MWKYVLIPAFFISIFSIPARSFAQSQSSVRGELGGTVVDASKSVVAGASVTISGPTGSASTMTNEQGAFSFSGLIPGAYSVKVEKTGFKSASVQNVEVQINRTVSIQVQLELGTVAETIEVIGTSISVESTSTAVNMDISDAVYEKLPLGRSVTSIFYLSPGVASGLGTGAMNPAISGGTGLENAYVADGVVLNDAAFGGMGIYSSNYGSIGVGINLSFVKDVQIKTGGFEPQYGRSTGGVITIVTKSGGTTTHGVIGGYFQSKGMSAVYANNDDFNPTNLYGRQLHLGGYEGDFELGGYVPLGKLKQHLFYFGAFNPTWNHNWVAPAKGFGLFKANPEIDRETRVWDYSGKLTWQVNAKHSIESLVFSDPSLTNVSAFRELTTDNTSANSQLDYLGRSWATRYDGVLGASWIVSGAFSWNWNRFNEIPGTNLSEIRDLTGTQVAGGRGSLRAEGLGFLNSYDSTTKSLAFDTSKQATFAGHHTFSVGYYWQFPKYNNDRDYSGPRTPIPLTNHDGASYLGPTQLALVTGQSTDAYYRLVVAPTSCTLCPIMNVPTPFSATTTSVPEPVAAYVYRGIFSSPISHNAAKYHAAYVNDSWQMGNHVTLSMGVRWEQQRITAAAGKVSSVLNDQWGPRIGVSVDPKGDRKSKIYANFGRYAWVMPLDAAIRELTVESDYRNAYFAPVTDSSGNLVLDKYGSVTIQPDAAHLLNRANGGIAKSVTASSVGGNGGISPIQPGTRMEYTDEFLIGAEHEFRGGVTISARYIDRRIKRIIEDFSGVSIEQSNAGFGQFYAIGNVSSKADYVVNSKEIAFSQGATFAPTKVPCTAPNTPPGCDPTITVPTGFPAGCYDSNGNLAPNDLNEQDTFGTVLGSACWPSVDMNPWTDSSGNILTDSSGNILPKFGGETGADGQPDGNADPKREYQAVEIEINKSFSHNWSLISNWRIARLRGNFEGAFRNDNGQADPGISSLFDFTPGLLNTLGKQLAVGPLNADRLHIINIYPTYILDRGPLKGLILTPGVKIQSGVPLTTLAAQSNYGNYGEVPIFGRGDLGRLPMTGTVDAHVEYPWVIREGKSLHLAVDFQNIANTKRPLSINQFVDLSYQTLNADFKKPGNGIPDNLLDGLTGGFVAPFSVRFKAQFVF
jgi:hypothetical protein